EMQRVRVTTDSAVANPPIADGARDAVDVMIGFGEVGRGLYAVLGERRAFAIYDPQKGFNADDFKAEWMHVAIPYGDEFVSTIVEYTERYEPENVVLHSTVPVQTTRQVEKALDYAADVFFSPVRGKHPDLAGALRRFPKYYASSIMGELDARFESYF